jgi:hypothetical protein
MADNVRLFPEPDGPKNAVIPGGMLQFARTEKCPAVTSQFSERVVNVVLVMIASSTIV